MIYFVDLDGTIVKRDKLIISPKKINVPFSISTGRTFKKTNDVISNLKPKYIIVENGQKVYKEGEKIIDLSLTKEEKSFLINNGHFLDVDGNIASKSVIYPKKFEYNWNEYRNHYEIARIGVNKGSTESLIAKKDNEEFVHIGDSYNDISAIALSKKTFAIKGSILSKEKGVVIIRKRKIMQILKKGIINVKY